MLDAFNDHRIGEQVTCTLLGVERARGAPERVAQARPPGGLLKMAANPGISRYGDLQDVGVYF